MGRPYLYSIFLFTYPNGRIIEYVPNETTGRVSESLITLKKKKKKKRKKKTTERERERVGRRIYPKGYCIVLGGTLTQTLRQWVRR